MMRRGRTRDIKFCGNVSLRFDLTPENYNPQLKEKKETAQIHVVVNYQP